MLGVLLVGVGGLDKHQFIKRLSHQLEGRRQVLAVKPTGNTHGRQSGQIERPHKVRR